MCPPFLTSSLVSNAQSSEVGATTSLFPFTSKMTSYLNSTRRAPIAEAAEEANKSHNFLRADTNAAYDQVITINLSELEPHINGPFTPDLSTPLSKFKDVVKENEWPEQLSAGLIGSCTNSSYQDMLRAEDLVKQAAAAGLKPRVDFFVTPGSEQIRATLERDETLDVFEKAGGTVLANACGPWYVAWDITRWYMFTNLSVTALVNGSVATSQRYTSVISS